MKRNTKNKFNLSGNKLVDSHIESISTYNNMTLKDIMKKNKIEYVADLDLIGPFLSQARLTYFEKKSIDLSGFGYQDSPALSMMFFAVAKNKRSFLSRAIAGGADINFQDNPFKNTALHYASVYSEFSIIETILAVEDCNPTLLNSAQKSASELAIYAQRPDKIIEKLMDAEIGFSPK